VGASAVAERVASAESPTVTLTTYATTEEARAALRDGGVDAVLEGEQLVGLHTIAPQLLQTVQAAAVSLRIEERIRSLGGTSEDIAYLGDPAPVDAAVLDPGDPNRDQNGAIAFVGVILLYGQLFGYGVWVASGVIEEKSSRVVEILLSTIHARQLMTGKILGIGLLGLAQLTFIGTFAITVALTIGAIDVPGTALRAAGLVLGFFVLGFAFYASLFAVAGALVSRMEELQNAIVPINLVIFVSFFISIGALQDPDGTVVRVASMLPTSSPLAMPVRIVLGSAAPWEIAVAVVLLIGSTIALVPIAGRLYAGAVLRTGGRVKIRDAWRAAR
jgi:ABC-2 type transport system permease protein